MPQMVGLKHVLTYFVSPGLSTGVRRFLKKNETGNRHEKTDITDLPLRAAFGPS